jgi:hypothetical protein
LSTDKVISDIEGHHGENAYITHLAVDVGDLPRVQSHIAYIAHLVVDVGEMPRVQSHICYKFVL